MAPDRQASGGFGYIVGVVMDRNGCALPGAHVVVPVLSRAAVADSSGRFQLLALPDSTYWLEVRKLGYLRDRYEVKVQAGWGDTLTVRMRDDPVPLRDLFPERRNP